MEASAAHVGVEYTDYFGRAGVPIFCISVEAGLRSVDRLRAGGYCNGDLEGTGRVMVLLVDSLL